MKLKHLILFIISCAVLILSELPVGSLFALAALFQIALLINGIQLTKQTQLTAFKIFLFSLPTFFFWGGIHSFLKIYFTERNWVFFLMALSVTTLLSLIVAVQCVLVFKYISAEDFTLTAALQKTVNDLRNKKSQFIKVTGLILTFSFVPWLEIDWKLIFSVMATLLFLNQPQLKQAFYSRPS